MIALADMQNHFSLDLCPGTVTAVDNELLDAGISVDLQGRSFNHGLIRFHSSTSRPRWAGIIKNHIRLSPSETLPLFFDWEGRNVFFHRESGRTYFVDPSTNEVDWVTQSIVELLEKICSNEGPDVLDEEDFEAARRHLGGPSLGFDECIGFVLPLFLGGSEEPSNREVTDMEVFWEINRQLTEQTNDLQVGTPIEGIELKD